MVVWEKTRDQTQKHALLLLDGDNVKGTFVLGISCWLTIFSVLFIIFQKVFFWIVLGLRSLKTCTPLLLFYTTVVTLRRRSTKFYEAHLPPAERLRSEFHTRIAWPMCEFLENCFKSSVLKKKQLQWQRNVLIRIFKVKCSNRFFLI